jgi:hypothetical protein
MVKAQTGVTMRLLISSLTYLVLASPGITIAQTKEPPVVPGAQVPGQQTAEEKLYAEDGGARGGTLESIIVPPKAKAQFSLILETVWARGLADGGTITLENKRKIARDAEGRIYMERWLLVPRDGKQQSQMTAIQISDPLKHTLYSCFPHDSKKRCQLVTYTPSPDTVFNFFGSSQTIGDYGDTVWLDLGKQLVSGVETVGQRVTEHYNQGAFGNDRVMTVEREFWYSPKLGFNLLSTRSDPRIGKQTFTVTNLILSDPDANLFEVPEGYSVVDDRQTAPAEN